MADGADGAAPPAWVQQLAAAINAGGAGARAGGSHKLAKIYDPDPRAWTLWLEDFHRVVQMNDWTNTRARLELSTALQGKLKEAVHGIEVNAQPAAGAADADDYRLLVNQYHARIVPPNLQELYLDQFRNAKQRPKESLVDFHRRLQYLFTTSHPGVAVANNADLCRAFCEGVLDKDVGLKIYDARDAAAQTYQGCLTVAQKAQVGLVRYKNRRDTEEEARQHQQTLREAGQDPGQGERALYALQSQPAPDHSNKKCFECGRKGHIARNCDRTKSSNRRKRSRSRSPRASSNRRRSSNSSRSTKSRDGSSRRPSSRREDRRVAHVRRSPEASPRKEESDRHSGEEDQGNY